MEAGIYQLRQYATDKDIPIDGIVVSFNDIAYAQSCGRTGHHYKDGLAYKFEDDLHESLLQYIEWTPGRTGEIAPVAVFTPVEIDGCEVSRASLHNLSFIEDLELMAGNRILVSKRNMIIPHVEENLDRGGFSMVDTIPMFVPAVDSLPASMNQVERAKMARIASSRRCTVITLTARHVG